MPWAKAEILADLPNLKPDERSEILQRLCELQEHDLLNGARPSPAERELLDRELAEFERDRDMGTPWRDVIRDIRSGPAR